MSDFTKTYARMMEQGTAMLKAFNPMLEDFTPEGFDKLWPTMPRDWMEAMFGNSFNPDGLDAKTRLMVLLAVWSPRGDAGQPDQIHGASPDGGGRHAERNWGSHLPDVDAGWTSGDEPRARTGPGGL